MRTSHACLLALVLAAPFMGSNHAAAEAATLELLSETTTAADSIGTASQPALSADGRYVAFLSSAPNLAPGQEDDNHATDVFLHDRVLGTTTLVSHVPGSPTRAASPAAAGEYGSLDISADGRYVVFSGRGVALVPGAAGSPLVPNVFLWDRVTDTTTLVSHAAGSPGTAANDLSFYVRISADGHFVVFTSFATNLVAGQADNTNPFGGTTTDVFLWNRAADTTTLVSRRSGTAGGTSTGTPAITGNGSSFAPVLSADGGVVVFATVATDLLPNLVNLSPDAEIYAWQRSTDTLSLVSRAATSPQVMAGASHEGLAVSADGRYVAFASPSANLVPGQVDDDFSTLDAFLYDRATGEMRLVSHRSASPLLAGGVFNPAGIAMSANGRYVAFSSEATDLAPGQVDTNQGTDVFVYDRDTGLIALASHRHDSATTAGSGSSSDPGLSADGRFLVFNSFAVDLVPGQTDVPGTRNDPGTSDVFLYEQASRSVTLVSRSRALASNTGNRGSFAPILSADGSVAAFLSQATDLGEGQTDPYNFVDLFLYQRTSGEITSPSRRDPDLPPPMTAFFSRSLLGSLSLDGRFLVFESQGSVFLRDTVADTTTRLLLPPFPEYVVELSQNPVLSADGRFIAFISSQNPIVSPTLQGPLKTLHLYDRAAGTFTLVNHAPGSPMEVDGSPSNFALSADGRWVAYSCDGCGLVPGHSNPPGVSRFLEIFLYDRLSGTNVLVSRAANTSHPALRPDGQSTAPSISADGRHVVFWSFAANLVPGQIDFTNTPDLFVFDRESGPAGSMALITHRPGFPERSATTLAPPSSSPLPPAVLSEDGRFIAFQSVLPNLVEGQVDTNGGADVFLYNQGTRANLLVSHAASSPIPAVLAGNAPSSSGLVDGTVSMSADGRFIAYESLATDLAAGAGDTNGAKDVFLYDRLLGTNALVSYNGSVPLVAATGASGIPRISADGRRVAFLSTATDLILNQAVPTGWYNLYVQEPGSGTRTFIARAFRNPRPHAPFPSDGPLDDPRSFVPHLSANGRRVGFNSEAGLVPGDYNGTWDVYLWDQDGVEEPEEPEGPIAVPPCRLLDTRRRAERPVLTSNVRRTVTAHGRCGVPDTAKEIVVKVTVFNPSGKGNLRFYPGDVTVSPSAILRFERGTARTETFTLPLSANGTLTILPFVAGRGTVHAAVEVTGYSE